MSKLSVGQTLWWVPRDRRQGSPREVRIVKVGRKWAELDNYQRIDMETMVADGGDYMPPGYCYLSQAEYEWKLARQQVYSRLRSRIPHAPPAGLSIADIEHIATLLNVDIKE